MQQTAGPAHRLQQTKIAAQVGDLGRSVLTSHFGAEDHLFRKSATEHGTLIAARASGVLT